MSVSQSTPSSSRILDIEGVINFRDLGGYQTQDGRYVKWGRVYRSAQLDRMSKKGINDMAELGIQTVVDLRFSDETSRYPTIRAAVPKAQILSWHDEQQGSQDEHSNGIQRSWRDSLDSNDPQQVREAMRVNYPKKLYSHRAIYRKMLLSLAQNETPLVFHCAAGKDRTGVAAALILSLLGVSDQVIIEDYLITQSQISRLLENWVAGGATDQSDYQDFQQRLAQYPRELVQPVFDADEAYILTLLDYIKSTYGDFAAYAEQVLKVDDDVVTQLSTNLLGE